jgi:hypothetical protein
LRRCRRAAYWDFSNVAVCDYRPVISKEAILLASSILETPEALDGHFKRYAASTILSILYDYPTLDSEHDKMVTKIHTFFDRLSAVATHLVNFFPWMTYIPGR